MAVMGGESMSEIDSLVRDDSSQDLLVPIIGGRQQGDSLSPPVWCNQRRGAIDGTDPPAARLFRQSCDGALSAVFPQRDHGFGQRLHDEQVGGEASVDDEVGSSDGGRII